LHVKVCAKKKLLQSLLSYFFSVKNIVFIFISLGMSAFVHPSMAQGDESVEDLYGFYQKFISDIRPVKCQMYPSCAKYSMQSFRTKGVIMGFLDTTDRLMRCGHEHDFYTVSLIDGEPKLLDIIEPSDSVYAQKTIRQFSSNSRISKTTDPIKLLVHLIDQELYREAILEYHRIKLDHPEYAHQDLLELNYYKALFALGEYERVIFHYDHTLAPELKENPQILMKTSESWFKLKNYNEAIKLLTKLEIPTESDQKNALSGLVYTHWDKFEQAKEAYSLTSDAYIYSAYIQNNLALVTQLERLRYKSPTLAGLLSIIPGAGYIYTGHTTTAATSFILTGLLGYGTYTSFKNSNYGIGVLTGLFSTAFYIGNISGGAKSAKRYNESEKNKLKKKLMYQYQ
jgi:tetratricopeptide (TPR) repeat protein